MSEPAPPTATSAACRPSPAALLPVLPLTLTLELRDPLVLPEYPGSTFRGALGMALRRVACTLRDQQCETCLLRTHCVYLQLFDTPTNEDGGVPRPFVLEPPPALPGGYRAGATVRLGLTLFGRAIRKRQYFLKALGELGGRWGLGSRSDAKSFFRIVEVTEAHRPGSAPLFVTGRELREPQLLPDPWSMPLDAVNELTLELVTPLRLKVKGDLQTPEEPPSFALIMDRLLHRFRLLAKSDGVDPATADTLQAPAGSDSVILIDDPLRWKDWGRYSRRQGRPMRLGGVQGRLTYRGALAPFIPWLRFGRWLHIGKNPTFGLGRYRLLGIAGEKVCEDRLRRAEAEGNRALSMG